MKKIISFLMVVMLMVSLAACGNGEKTQEQKAEVKSKVDEIKERGYLLIGTSADYPPYETHIMVDGKDEIVGLDIEIAKEIAKSMGVELKIEDMNFDALLLSLATGKIDMVLAAMSATEERKEKVDFSMVYYNPKQTIIIRKEDAETLNSLEAFEGKTVGVQKGTIQEEFADQNMPKSEKIALAKIPNLILEVKTGKSDAVVLEEPVANAYISQNPELTMANIEVAINSDEGSSVALKKGDAELLKVVDETIKKLIEEKKIDQMVIEANKLLENE